MIFVVKLTMGRALGESWFTVRTLLIGRALLAENHYSQAAIRTSLTRNLHACFPDVRDEIVCAFNDILQLQGSGTLKLMPHRSSLHNPEWKTLPVLPTTMSIVARVSNRLFVGLPLCELLLYKLYISLNNLILRRQR
jgi:hypothetical protein